MTPRTGEYIKTVGIEEIRTESPKLDLITYLDEIAKKYDSEELVNNPDEVGILTNDITEALYEEERKRLNNEKGEDPVRVVQAMNDGWGDIYGLGFGIEIAYRDGENESYTNIEYYWRMANKIDKISDGVYTSFIPKYYRYTEQKKMNTKNISYQGFVREIILCSARVTTSELFRNMDIPERITADVIQGLYDNIRERAENETI